MAQSIAIKLIDSVDTIVKESEKKKCFFVGAEGEATNAVFKHSYEITNQVWPKDIIASYEIGSRMFSRLSYSIGQTLYKARGAYDLKKHPDGTVYLCMSVDYPAFDSYDSMYSCHFERIIYRENGEVVVIQAKYGRVVPKINVFVGLSESVPYLDRLLEILDNSDAEQTTRITMLTRAVAQKYRLRHAIATQMENFVLYACLTAAGFSASYSAITSRGRNHSYDALKTIADYVCGACFPLWYQTETIRRHEILGDLVNYIRHLKRDKYVPWSDDEKAFCHAIRKWIDVGAFTEIYSITLVLLRFLAENDFSDVFSLKTVANYPGIFNATILADTVDEFKAKHLDGEAKKSFFSISGKQHADAKLRVERALYNYHAGSSVLFRATRALTLQSSARINESDAKARESAVEKAVMSAGAKAALMHSDQSETDIDIAEAFEDIIHAMCDKIRSLYPGCTGTVIEEKFVYQKLIDIANYYLRDEIKSMFLAGQSDQQAIRSMVPENSFVIAYVTGFIMIRFLTTDNAKNEGFNAGAVQAAFEDQKSLQTETLKQLILEAKCYYSYYYSNDFLRIIAGMDNTAQK